MCKLKCKYFPLKKKEVKTMKLNLCYAMLAKLTNLMQTQLQNFPPITQREGKTK